MVKFKDLKYERYTIDRLRAEVEPQIAAVENAQTFADALKAREKANEAFGHFATMSALSYARYSLDTRDKFYTGEVEYYDENSPYMQDLGARIGKAFAEGKFKKDVEAMSPALVKSIENTLKANAPEIMPGKQQEAAVVMQYSKLMSTMQFDFDGKKLPLSVVDRKSVV